MFVVLGLDILVLISIILYERKDYSIGRGA